MEKCVIDYYGHLFGTFDIEKILREEKFVVLSMSPNPNGIDRYAPSSDNKNVIVSLNPKKRKIQIVYRSEIEKGKQLTSGLLQKINTLMSVI